MHQSSTPQYMLLNETVYMGGKKQIFTQQRSQFLLLFHKISMLQYLMQHLLYQSVSVVVLYLSTEQPLKWKSLKELHNRYSRSQRANKLTLLINTFYIHYQHRSLQSSELRQPDIFTTIHEEFIVWCKLVSKQCYWYSILMKMSINTTNITYLHRTAKNSSNQNIQKVKQVIGIQDSQNSWKIYEEISSYFATTYHMLLY